MTVPAVPDTYPKVKMVCAECGDESVLADAYVQWNIETQDWDVANVFEKGGYCDTCEGEARYNEVKI